MTPLKIPVGISDFKKLRENGYYYIDKSGLIADLLTNNSEVTLITRPRRFGKTLAMSMLANFFDIRKKTQNLFTGLQIESRPDLCQAWMNQFPTLFLTFKDVDGLDYAFRRMCRCLASTMRQARNGWSRGYRRSICRSTT